MQHRSFRSQKASDAYNAHRATGVMEHSCPLCEREPLRAFTYWKIIKNNFPYDLIASVHHMLVPLRHVPEIELTDEELEEFRMIKSSELEDYDFMIEGTQKTKSIPAHFHIHLIEVKEDIR